MSRNNIAPQTPMLVVGGLVVLMVLASVSATSQEQPFTGSVEVNLVNVEAWVTDLKGRHITGLTADDFEVFEDGKPVQLSHFREIRGGRSVIGSDQPLAELETSAPLVEGSTQATLVLYFDLLHLDTARIATLVDQVKEALATFSVPAERVIMVTQANKLAVEVPLGSSRETLETALDGIVTNNRAAGQSQREKRLQIAEIRDQWEFAKILLGQASGALISTNPTASEGVCEYFVPRALAGVRAFASKRGTSVARTLGSLTQTVDFLAGVPGVKTLVYVSDDLELNPGSDLLTYMQKLCPLSDKMRENMMLLDDMADEFLLLTSHASANRVTMYTMQSTGLRIDSGMGAEYTSHDLVEGQSSLWMAVRAAELAGQRLLAAQTGGRAIFNTQAFGRELGRIDEEITGFYSLAFTPLQSGDGKEHTIKVTVKRSGLDIRHRRRYLDKSADRRVAERLTTTIQLGLTDNPLGVKLAAGQLRAGKKESWILPLHVLVPAERLTYVPAGDGSEARVKLFVARSDEEYGSSPVHQRLYVLPRPNQENESMLDLVADLELAAGVQVLGVAVVEDITRDASFVATTIKVEPTT